MEKEIRRTSLADQIQGLIAHGGALNGLVKTHIFRGWDITTRQPYLTRYYRPG